MAGIRAEVGQIRQAAANCRRLAEQLVAEQAEGLRRQVEGLLDGQQTAVVPDLMIYFNAAVHDVYTCQTAVATLADGMEQAATLMEEADRAAAAAAGGGASTHGR